MRILFLSEFYHPVGGAEQYMLSIMKTLEMHGHDVGIIYSAPVPEHFSMPDRYTRASGLLMLTRLDLNEEDLSELDQIVASFRPDVLYVHQVHSFALLRHLADRWPLIKFVHDHRFICPAGPAFLPVGKSNCLGPCGLVRCALTAGIHLCCGVRWPHRLIAEIHNHRRGLNLILDTRLIVASRYMHQILVRNGFSESRIEILPQFCEFENATPGIQGNYILFCGRLQDVKGLDLLIRSMKTWPKELGLIVLGEGPERSKCEALAIKLGVENRVRFLGFVPNHDEQVWFSGCLALAVPSIWGEPFGIVGLEAMCHAKPVIAFNVGGIAEWLEDGKTGRLVRTGEVGGLAKAIQEMHTNRDLAKIFGETGRNRYFQMFSRDQHLRQLLTILKQAQC